MTPAERERADRELAAKFGWQESGPMWKVRALELIEAARREERERCAAIAGGWSGPINTVENCAVVSEVCREIAKAIRERRP